jgi:hypothetical protein
MKPHRVIGWSLTATLLALGGCSPSGASEGPVHARPIDGRALTIENSQHSSLWTFSGFQACTDALPEDLSFVNVQLKGSSDSVTGIRGGVSWDGRLHAAVTPGPLPASFVEFKKIVRTDIPVTGCPASGRPLQFAFEVNSEKGWTATGFDVSYVADGANRILSWDLPVSVCGVNGCDSATGVR